MSLAPRLNQFRFIAIIAVVLACVDAYASTENLVLICEYPARTNVSGPHAAAVPREIEVNFSARWVQWSGSPRSLPAGIDERTISFRHNGFQYSISRTTGQIRFSNPAEIARWQESSRGILSGGIKQGLSVSQAQAERDEFLRSKFTANEHVGMCSPASKPKF